jgi:autotransporter-associated beta strand protein
LNDNLGLYYEETNNNVPWGGEFVHIEYNGAFKDGLTTSGNLIAHAREGTANDNNGGRVYVYHRFNGNNSAWTGDLVISDNPTYNHDVNNIVRLGNANALSNKNDIIMNYNSILQAGGNTVNVGALITRGGDGQLYTNVGTLGASGSGSSEIIENAAATPGTLVIHQTTPATAEVKWDALFRDGTLPSHYLQPGQSQAGAALNIVKQGNGWATLTLDNDHTGTTTLSAGILQVGVDGFGDTGATRGLGVLGLSSANNTILAGTGVIQGKAEINGALKPGDVAGRGMGALFVNGDLDLKATSTIELQIQRATLNVPELLKLTNDLNKPIQYDDRRDYFFVSTNLTGLENGYYTPDTLATAQINEHDQLRIAGDLNVASGAQFSVILNGYTPRAGDVFKLLDFAENVSTAWNVGSQFRDGTESGTQLTLPVLGNNFRWDTSLFTTKGLLLVVGVDVPPHQPTSEDPDLNRAAGIGSEDHPQQLLVPLSRPFVSFASAVTLGSNTSLVFEPTWYKNNTELLDPESRIIGLADNTVTITELTTADVGKYSVRFNSTTPGQLPLNSSAAVLAMYDDVDYNQDQARFTKNLKAGSSTTLSVTTYAPTGVTLQYQWGKVVNGDFEPIEDNLFPQPTATDIYTNTTTKTLTISKFSAAGAGIYACRITLPGASDLVTGPAQIVTAGTQKLNLLGAPVLGTPPATWTTPGLTVAVPYSFQFPLDVGSSPVTKWTATGLPAGLTINSTTGLISGTPTENKTWDKVRITASNATGSISWPSTTAFGSIVVNPGIEVVSTTIAVVRGKVATASVKAYKNNVSYQWFRADAPTTPLVNGVTANGSKLAGATSSKLTITGFTDTAPSNVGAYFCKVTVKLPPTTNTQTFDSGTTTFVIMQDPDLQDPGTGMDNPITLPPATVGALYTYQFPVVNDPSRPLAWSIKGLPAGLTMDPKTGVISGTITKLPSAALFNSTTNSYTISNVEVTGKNAVATVRSPVAAIPPALQTYHTIVVKALPVTAVGKFVALIDREGQASPANGPGPYLGSTKNHGGRVTLTATVNGAVTGKVFIGKDNSKGLSFKTKLVTTDLLGAALPEPTGVAYIARKGKPYLQVNFTLRGGDVFEGTVQQMTGGLFNTKTQILTGGTLVPGSITDMSGWRSKWIGVAKAPALPVLPSADHVGVHNVSLKLTAPSAALPEGTGYASITVVGTGKSAGNVTVVGKTALGEAFTSANPLSPLGEVLVYSGVNSDKKVFTGSLHGFVNIQSAPSAHRINDTALLTWGRGVQPSTERKYRKGWAAPIGVNVAGGLYVAPVTRKAPLVSDVILGLPVPTAPTVNNASILFTGGGVTPELGDTTAIRGDLGSATVAGFQFSAPAKTNITKLPLGSNNGKTSLTVTTKTGVFTGNFTTVDRAAVAVNKVTRAKVLFSGIVVPLVGVPSATNPADFSAAGYFLLPEMLPAPSTATTKTPVKSGLVEIKTFP